MNLPPPTRLWNRSFTVWLLGSAQSQLGGTLSSLAMSFFVLAETGSAGGVALTLAFSLLPNLLAPVAGALVDRVHLKVPMVASDVVRGGLQQPPNMMVNQVRGLTQTPSHLTWRHRFQEEAEEGRVPKGTRRCRTREGERGRCMPSVCRAELQSFTGTTETLPNGRGAGIQG